MLIRGNNELRLFFFGHRSLIRNNTQTAVTNMTIKRILENKIHKLDVSYVSTYIFRSTSDRL